jgi:hypothetical protein
MADEFEAKRIINLPAESAPADGDFFVVDNETTGTKKLGITGLIDETPTQNSNKAVSSGGTFRELGNKADKESTPNIATPEETEADFYLSDAKGNAILELADGHIRTKNFNSSDINTDTDTTLRKPGKPADAGAVGDAIDVLQEEIDSIEQSATSGISTTEQSTDADADIYISDPAGNGLMRVSGGYIQTKNFNSDNGVYKKVFAFTGPGNQTITRFFPAGTTLVFHLYDQTNKKTGAVASYKVTYTYTDKDNTAHTLGQEYGYNFPTYTLPEDAIAVSVIYGNIIIGGNHDLTFAVYSEGSFPRKPKIIKVAQDGSGDFTTLRGAVDSISDNNEYNPFEIWIYPGTYNVLEDYTDAEISASGYQGLFICDGVSLIGQGQRSEIIINGTLDTTKFEQSKRNDVSTLNITGTCRLENLTIKGSYIRYAIHDDTGSPVHKRNSRTLKNLKVYGEHMTSGGYGQISYGAGGSNLKTVYAIDCDFSDCMGIHTDANAVHSFHVYLENCTARRFNFGDYDSGIPTYYFMRNCKEQVIYIGNNTGHTQYLMLDGECTNNAMVMCPAGYVYSIGDCRKFYNQSVPAGKAVKLTNNYGGISIATNIDDIYGVSLGIKDSVTYVQIGGWLNVTMLGLTGLSVGDYLTIDSSGNVVSGGTVSNAIAQVKFIDENAIIFAKMEI